MIDFPEELFEPFKKFIEYQSLTPKLLSIHVSKYIENQSDCKKIPDGKDFYLIMGYDFFRDFKKQSGLTRTKSDNISFWAGTPIYFDDEKMREEIFSKDKGE